MAEANPFDDAFRPKEEANPFDEPKADNSLHGYLKSIGQGLKNVISNYALAPGYAEAEQMAMEGVPNPGESDIALGGEGGVQTVPKEPSEHPFVTNLTSAFADPLSWAGPGGVVSKTAGILGSTLGGEAGRHAAAGSAYEIPAQIAGSLAGGHLALAPGHIVAGPKPIAPDRQALIDELKKEGITDLTSGQQRGNEGLSRMETLAGNSLFAGNKAQNVAENQKRQLTQALLKRFDAEGEAATPDVINNARDRLIEQRDKIAKNLPVRFTKDLGDNLVKIEQDAFNEGFNPDEMRRITQNIENVRNGFVTKAPKGGLDRTIAEMRANAGTAPPASLEAALQQGVNKINATPTGNPATGVMSGKTYQALTHYNSALSNLQRETNGNLSRYGSRIRDALDDAMASTASVRGTREGVGRRQALADLSEWRRKWRTMLITSKAVASGGADAAKGLVSPAQLRMQLSGTPKDKELYARSSGSQGLNDLSRAANAIMTPLPNSGTPAGMQALENLNLASTLRGVGEGAKAAGGAYAGGTAFGPIGAVVGAIGVPLSHGLIGRALHSQPVRNYLTGQTAVQKMIGEGRPGASPSWLAMVNLLKGNSDQRKEASP